MWWMSVLLAGCFLVIVSPFSYAAQAVMAHGWSYEEEDSLKAIQEAIEGLKNELGSQQPSVIFFSSTSIQLDVPTMVAEVQKAFPDTPVWGATSALGLFMNNDAGYMRGSVVGLLALCSEEYQIFVEGASIRNYEQSYTKAAEQIINHAREFSRDAMPSMVLFTSNPGPHEEAVIELLKTAFNRSLPIFGGSCGTEAPNPRFSVANGEAHEEGLALCFLYTSTKKIGYHYQMGYKREDVSGVATKVDGRLVNEIDGKPAIDVYNEWTGGFFTDIIREGKPIRGEGQMYHPLAMVKKTADGEELIISLSAKTYSKDTGGIEFFACVDEGDELTVLKGDTDSLVNRAYLGVMQATRMAKGKIAGGLVFYCSGARLLLEKQGRTAEMSPKLKQAFRDKPFILMFHNGEHGCIPGSESFHGNLMLDVVVFGE